MSPRIQYDLDLFRDLVKSGKTKKEIMRAMSIKYITTFNSLQLKLMDTDKKYYSTKDSSNNIAKPAQRAAIGINNNLTLSPKIFENSTFKPGDAFDVKVSKNKIVLTLVEE